MERCVDHWGNVGYVERCDSCQRSQRRVWKEQEGEGMRVLERLLKIQQEVEKHGV